MTIPGGLMAVGKTIRVTVMGVISTTGTPTVKVDFDIGGTTDVVTTGTQTLTASGLSSNLWHIELYITAYTVGGSGSYRCQGYLQIESENQRYEMRSTGTIGVNTTTDDLLDLELTWGTASASNTWVTTNVVTEVLN